MPKVQILPENEDEVNNLDSGDENTNFVWDTQSRVELIKLYKKRPRLWKTAHPEFIPLLAPGSIQKRRVEINSIAKKFNKNKAIPFSHNSIRDEISRLRSKYRQVIINMKKAEARGKAMELPTWDCFEHLEFLSDTILTQANKMKIDKLKAAGNQVASSPEPKCRKPLKRSQSSTSFPNILTSTSINPTPEVQEPQKKRLRRSVRKRKGKPSKRTDIELVTLGDDEEDDKESGEEAPPQSQSKQPVKQPRSAVPRKPMKIEPMKIVKKKGRRKSMFVQPDSTQIEAPDDDFPINVAPVASTPVLPPAPAQPITFPVSIQPHQVAAAGQMELDDIGRFASFVTASLLRINEMDSARVAKTFQLINQIIFKAEFGSFAGEP